ncbi:MAG: YkgJ family cysteine cluster protein [Methylophilus sp.]|uniref:YkgJ family cysteine cluster protein n=1 Tax=Methylophilus sp. TaxID=29541 RepID=UPI003FA11C09
MTQIQTPAPCLDEIQVKQQETMQHANNVLHVIQMQHGQFFDQLPLKMNAIVTQNASVRTKRNHIRILALDINEKVSSQTACRKQCSHCCHIPVLLSSHEAETISQKTGIQMNATPEVSFTPEEHFRQNKVEKYLETRPQVGPCTFLAKDGGCSIYENRPLMCITHHSLDKTDFFCRTDLDPDLTTVPSINTHFIHEHYAGLDLNFKIADIRQFFPSTQV